MGEAGDVVSAGECCWFGVEVVRECCGCGGALQGECGGCVALVFEGDVTVELVSVMGNPIPILLNSCCIYHEEKRLRTGLIRDEVIDDAAGRVSEEGILAFAGREFAEVVCEQGVKEGACIVAGHLEFTHVGDVEEAATGAYGFVFG